MIYIRSTPIGRPLPQLRSPQINGLFFFASVFALLLLLYEVISDIALLLFAPGHLMMYGGEPTEYFCECVRYMCAWGSLLTWRLYNPSSKKRRRKSHPRGATGGTLQHSTCVCVCVWCISSTHSSSFLTLAITRMSDAGALLSERKKYTHILYLEFFHGWSLCGEVRAELRDEYEIKTGV